MNRAYESNCEITYGCSLSEVLAINNGHGRSSKDHACYKYNRQKKNAKQRGIAWEITLPEWWRIWQESGKWEHRGTGKGYCMARNGDTGPYSPDNVSIKTAGENSSESFIYKPLRERRAHLVPQSHCLNGHERIPENLTKGGGCKICRAAQDRLRVRTNRSGNLSMAGGCTRGN